MNYGKLYLIPTPISGIDLNDTLTEKDVQIVKSLKHFIVETPKVARSYLGSLELKYPIREIETEVFDEHTDTENLQDLVQPLLAGYDVGLMTDAGTPCIADPGEEIVLLCHRLNIEVVPMIGPSSILLSLMASGLNAERFAFNGYLPKKPSGRMRKLNNLVDKIESNGETQIFIETPYRNQALFDDVMKLPPEIYLSIGINIGASNGKNVTLPISKWKERTTVLDKVPIIFIIGR